MKVHKIREMSLDEMVRKVDDLKQSLFNLRFQHEVKQLENPRRIMQTRHDIARINTVIREMELKQQNS